MIWVSVIGMASETFTRVAVEFLEVVKFMAIAVVAYWGVSLLGLAEWPCPDGYLYGVAAGVIATRIRFEPSNKDATQCG